METSTPRQRDSLLTPSYSTSASEFSRLEELKAREEDERELLMMSPVQCATDSLLLLSPNARVFEDLSPLNSSEQSSQVSNPFSDVVVDECVRKMAARDRRLLHEEVMAFFSPEFKKVMSEFRDPGKESLGPDDLSSVATMTAEHPNDIIRIGQELAAARRAEPRSPPSAALSGILDSLARSIDEYRSKTPDQEESDSYEDEGDDEDDEEEDGEIPVKSSQSRKPSRAPTSVPKKTATEDEEYFDTSSGLWRMLSAYDDLVLSQPGFNAYRQDEKHWLEKEPVPWKIMEESKNKCMEWLEKHHDQASL